MPREIRTARSGSVDVVESTPIARPARKEKGVFCKEGEYWTVGYGGKAFRLKDTKGIGDLAHLLRHPGVEFHVLDLVGGMASQREEHETSHPVTRLPLGEEDLEKAGIQITGLG